MIDVRLGTASAIALLTSLACLANSEAAPRHGTQSRATRPLTWRTTHGPRTTVERRTLGHGHAAVPGPTVIARSVQIQTPSVEQPRRTFSTRRVRSGARVYTHRHVTVTSDGEAAVPAPRSVIPATQSAVVTAASTSTQAQDAPNLPDLNDEQVWQVKNVLDATRLVVRRGRLTQQVRLLGLANSLNDSEAGRKYLEQLAIGRDVHLAFDENLQIQDAQGITTAYVFLADDETLLNLAMIEAGFAVTDGAYTHHWANTFSAAQAKAQAN